MDKEKLKGVIKLLSANDNESVVLGIATLEACHTESTMVSTLLAIKKSSVDKFVMEKNAPKLYKKLNELSGRPDFKFTYKEINNVLVNKKQEENQAELFIEYLNEDLTNTYKELGYTFIDKINVTIKQNTNE
tara:strand:- start:243 stop:638 length:396 start_codon:yes stop_codon:yes gene_type:complete